MSCASCAQTIDATLKRLQGVDDATINVANDTGVVIFDETQTSKEAIIKSIQDAGYDAELDKQSTQKIAMLVEGMTCASCVANVDRAVSALEGVTEVNVNIANDKMTLVYDKDKVRISDIKKAVQDSGYHAKLQEEVRDDVDPEMEKVAIAKKRMSYSAIIAGVMMTLMIVHMFLIEVPFYTPIVAIMAIPVVFVLGRHVHIGAYKSLRNLRPNMDVLVSMGSLPPYLIGLVGLFIPMTTFIEMATAIMTFHLIGKYLETRAKGKASQAIKKLINLGAKQARILVEGEEIEVLTSELSEGDVMVIRPGEKIPTDGVVIEGESLIDESIATGESMPVKRQVDDEVIGATINKVDARLYHPKALGKVKIVYALQEKNIFQIMYKSIGESMIIFNNTIKIHANTSLKW